MKILLLSQFFWPEKRTAPTNLAAMAADLADLGHDVLAVTGFPNHPFGRVYDGYRIKHWEWDSYKDVRILRLPLYPDHSDSLTRRCLNHASFALAASSLGALLTRKFKPDLLFAYFAPVTMGIPVALFRWLHNIPAVYWVTDLWPENLAASGTNVSSRVYGIIRMLEDFGYQQASRICVSSPGFVKNLVHKGVDSSKLEVVSEWADESLFFPVTQEPELADSFGLQGRFNVMYAGNLGVLQGLDTVLEAAGQLRDLEGVQFVFIGDGNDEDRLRELAETSQLNNVRFLPRQPMDEIRRFLALADVLLVHLKSRQVFQMQLPSKILAYLACARPILCAVPGVAEQVVVSAEAGLSCSSEDPQALAQVVRRFYAMTPDARHTMGDRGRAAFLTNYTRANQVAKIERIFHSLIRTS